LLKQQLLINVYRLLTKEKNFLFLLTFAANKQKFAVSVSCLQQTNGSCHFPLFPFSICGIPKTWRHGHRDMEMETWKYRHETWKHGEMERDIETSTENGNRRPGDFLNPYTPLLIVQTEVCCLFVDEGKTEVILLQTD
jgi:hypothetical protein